MSRITRTEYYLRMATLVAERSTCCRAQVGAVLTNHNRVVGTGYNGGPAGTTHCEEDGQCTTDKEGRCITTIHAELNAILSREGGFSPEDSLIIYCTHAPCRHCYKAMVQYGVKEIIYLKYYEDEARDILVSKWKIPITCFNIERVYTI